MATVRPGIRKNAPNTDGSFGIKIVLSAKKKTSYLNTRFKIDNLSQWKDGRVVKHPDAKVINLKLHGLVCQIEELIDESHVASAMDAPELKAFVERNLNRSEGFAEFSARYIAELKANNQMSYAQNMGYTVRAVLDCFGANMQLRDFTPAGIEQFEKYLRKNGQSDTTINIRMSHLKALLNSAVNSGEVEYKLFPFCKYRMPTKNVREIWISKDELRRLREAEFGGISARRHTVARDLFMLSFYFAGINLTDLMDARLDSDTINFMRKKTAATKRGEKDVSLTIQPEARVIVDKYITADGTLDFGYNYSQYEQFRSFVTKGLNKIGEVLGFEKKLMFYSARKTFVQFGQQLGIPLYVLEYAIGQSIKDANNRPIFDYMKVMRFQADLAIRKIIDFSLDDRPDEDMPIPEWARRH